VLPDAVENKAPRGSMDNSKCAVFPRPELLQPCGDLWDEPLARGTNEGSGWGYREWGRGR